MFLMLGLCAGLLCGTAAAVAGRLWGTALAVAPVAGWFVFLIVAQRGGLGETEAEPLANGLLGILLGLFVGQVFERRRKTPSA